MVRVAGRVGLTHKNTGWVTGQPIFVSGQKIGFDLGIFWVGSGQKILTHFAMSITTMWSLKLINISSVNAISAQISSELRTHKLVILEELL